MPNKQSVPWRGIDVLLFFALWFACGVIVGHIATSQQSQEQTVAVEKEHHGHPVKQLVEQSKKSLLVFLFVFFGVVVVASLIEELLFRQFLQGWLEAKLSQFDIPDFAASGVAIVAVSLFFAVLHGESQGAFDKHTLFFRIVIFAITNLLIFAIGIYFLIAIRNMKLAHCLFGTKRFSRQYLIIIAGCCLLALVFVFGITYVLNNWYPDINTDPIPIFLFSLTLGVLYSVTRNLSYCVLLHACLNLTSLTIAWFGTAAL